MKETPTALKAKQHAYGLYAIRTSVEPMHSTQPKNSIGVQFL
ncbi:hypothetical protein QUA82_31095 [Microcoleus sp. F8-D3]